MIIKVLALIAVLVTVYLLFFKATRKENTQSRQKKEKPSKKELDGDTMIECAKCSTFISTKEAIIKDGKFFCSRECANL